jgi:hypothetical protein
MGQNDQNIQHIRTLRDPIIAQDHTTPFILKIATPALPHGQESTLGPMQNTLKARTYVYIDALPKELQERIKTAIEALSWG